MDIRIDSAAASKLLGRLSAEISKANRLMTQIGESQLEIDERFDTETDPDGRPWATLQPEYVDSKRRRRLSLKRNQATGDLKKSIKYRAFSDRVEIIADDPKASFVQAKRPFLYSKKGELGQKAEAQITQLTDNYLQKIIDS